MAVCVKMCGVGVWVSGCVCEGVWLWVSVSVCVKVCGCERCVVWVSVLVWVCVCV